MKPKLQVAIERQLAKAQRDLKEANRKLKQSYKDNELISLEREAHSALRDVKTHIIEPHKDAGNGEAVAVAVASDWHVEERVDLAQVNGLNQYNLDISKSRAEQFFRKVVRLIQIQRSGVDIHTLVLALLGDLITGHLHEQNVETNYLPPTEAAVYARNLIASGIEFILKETDLNIICPTASGNHGRTTKLSQFGSENGHSLEWMIYISLQEHFQGEPRVKFLISQGAHTYLDVLGYRVRFLHGHDVKYYGGSGGLTIPLNKAIAQWDKISRADYTVLGHFHQRLDTGNAIVNGSLIGYNAYALSIKASYEKPAQQFFLIDKKRGKTVVAPILFD